jgi:RimJ/RimL family protein N-acetyltransferase
MLPVPILETPRLRLRAHTLADFENSAAMWADPQVARYIGGKPSTREESWARFLRYSGLWALLGYGYWLVEEKATGRFVGDVGFGDFKRAVEPKLEGMPESGWALAASSHGKGYATEAAGAILAWADQKFPGAPTVCLIDAENAPSIRVAEKLGYHEFARTLYKDRPVILFRREGRE